MFEKPKDIEFAPEGHIKKDPQPYFCHLALKRHAIAVSGALGLVIGTASGSLGGKTILPL